MNLFHAFTSLPARPLARLVRVSAGVSMAALLAGCGGSPDNAAGQAALVSEGKQIFRFETFGDEAQWTDTLRLHEVIAAAVDPVTALSVGLKVDAEALPASVVQGIQNGSVDLKSPATTIALLRLDAVVGLKGTVQTVGGKDALSGSASLAPCAIRRWTTPSRQVSGSGSTAGPTGT